VKREVSIRNAHPRLRVSRTAVTRAIHLLDEQFAILPANRKSKIINHKSPVPPGELSLVFLTDPALAKIHGVFMADPTATDVITFEGNRDAGLAGEICVSADTARAYARANRRHFAAELTLYVVHGWLHLAGYDDIQAAKKRRMRAAEARAMKLLREAGAIPAFRLK
jgi:probable rRNA maturation factor